ncbi:MAG TPA: class II fructose-bisphosphate aldolase [Candidatus Binatus sp.]|uniref:class II fructose-bisphosphate aldolase n=1 Tax=Candidatus Binatus sp. TaxID=2811406 RepID=UPI002B488156|nr:class II fructose-bisphosphate aldolase [Candidatus Binatus sp.]HKN14284.1 class II fructose-bisphosphate aldolase [Candidatus Binatus sp.]
MISLREVLKRAEAEKVAVGHFNFSDLVGFNAIIAAARDKKLPVMVGVSEGEREFTGVRQAAALVKAVRDEYDYPIFLNADHTHSIAKAEAAAKAGFDEIIFDGSALSFEENIKQTKKAIEAIKSINPAVLVEGEIGWIGASSAVIDKVPEGVGVLTTPDEAKQFVEATKVDVLAPAVGNMHGMLASMVHGDVQKRLNIERIAEIKAAAKILMTLHGGSGTNDDDFRRAIKAGMTIVHVNTEIRIAWRRGVEAGLAADPNEVAPYKILKPAVEAVKDVVRSRLELFSSR